MSIKPGEAQSKLLTSMAQVFDERGDGVVVRGGPVELSKDDRVPHLSADDARLLLIEALASYHSVHRTIPARVVVHKTSTFSPAEIEGLRSGASAERVSVAEFVSVSREGAARLFRSGDYPPLRGSLLSLDDRAHVLYTRGSVPFYETYPGMYVPRPLLFRCEDTESTGKAIARELLALTKMNWNVTQFDGGLPITVLAADKVGDILRYATEDQRIASHYSFYM